MRRLIKFTGMSSDIPTKINRIAGRVECFHPACFMDSRVKKIFILSFLFVLFFPNTVFCLGKTESDSQNKNDVLTVNNFSQVSMREQYENGYWITKPSNNTLTVIGVSNPMLRRDDEIDAAKKDAALKVEMFFGIQGKIESVNSTGSSFFDYQHDLNAELIYDTDYEKYIERLTFDPLNDVLITREGVFIRFQYPASVTGINYNAEIINGSPSWIKSNGKPEMAGFVTAVGFSRNQRRLKDTILKSTQDAAIRMIEDLSTVVDTKAVSTTGQGSSSFIHAVSEGTLYGFQIIEFWIEPQTGYVYTLAIARAGG